MKSVRLLLLSLLVNFSQAADLADTDHDGIDDLSEVRYALDPSTPDDAGNEGKYRHANFTNMSAPVMGFSQ
jgi:hypothetical protein